MGLGRAPTVDRRGIEIASASVPGGGDDRLALGLGDLDSAATHRGGAEAHGGDLQLGAAELAFFPHVGRLPFCRKRIWGAFPNRATALGQYGGGRTVLRVPFRRRSRG